MSLRLILRLAISMVVVSTFCIAVAAAQSQDSQSVADAARRAREQKKAEAKPSKVITDEDIKPVKPADSQAAQTPQTSTSWTGGTGPAQVPTATAPATSADKDEKNAKGIAGLKEQIKQAQSDLDFLKRDQALQQDTYYSNPDYVHDTGGKAKLDAKKQQVSDKQEELEKLKARLTELGGTLDNPSANPGTATTPAAAPPKP